MGMSTHVKGISNLDGQFAKMMKVKLACEDAGIAYTGRITTYFKSPMESEEYLKQEMEEINIDSAITRLTGDSKDGYEVNLSKLPKEVKAIRFVNSY